MTDQIQNDGRPTDFDSLPVTLTYADVARVFGMTTRTIRSYVANGKIPTLPISKIRFSREVIRRIACGEIVQPPVKAPPREPSHREPIDLIADDDSVDGEPDIPHTQFEDEQQQYDDDDSEHEFQPQIIEDEFDSDGLYRPVGLASEIEKISKSGCVEPSGEIAGGQQVAGDPTASVSGSPKFPWQE